MREIVTLQVGACGNKLGRAFWDTITAEHGIDPTNGTFVGTSDIQAYGIPVYFSQASLPGRYVPRVILIDLDPQTSHHISGLVSRRHAEDTPGSSPSSHASDSKAPSAPHLSSDATERSRATSLAPSHSGMTPSCPVSSLESPHNCFWGDGGTGNNFAKGYCTEGRTLYNAVVDAVRRETEMCDSLQGFQVLHGLGGGTGSGLGSLLLEFLREDYPQRLIETVSIFPDAKKSGSSEIVVEPYNAMLAISRLVETTDSVLVVDNEALYAIACHVLKRPSPSLESLNSLVAYAVSGTSACTRFPGQLNAGLRKLAVNLTPFPRLHFSTLSFAPLQSPVASTYTHLSQATITQQLFQRQQWMCAVNPYQAGAKFLSCSVVYRGRVSSREVELALKKVVDRHHESFGLSWLPNPISHAICDIPPAGFKTAATALANTTAVRHMFQRVHKQFSALLSRKAFLHWYTEEGIDLEDMQQAEAHVDALSAEYEEHETPSSD